ncbi:hypothetical protein KIN20_007541 [Parelaphostrongylus tenuis]|uniref:Uncharacterized protein n=1 Tax=Parelaphostrongylus tenuis TaxID=148309 RepID=A0AAD5M6Q9_PARTN|nr:hypothetical protein KIN20_007541 [Parelaphostrongylus tenuis]
MKVEEPDLREESSSSMQLFNDASSVLYDNETQEAFDNSGGGDVSNKMSSAPDTQVFLGYL